MVDKIAEKLNIPLRASFSFYVEFRYSSIYLSSALIRKINQFTLARLNYYIGVYTTAWVVRHVGLDLFAQNDKFKSHRRCLNTQRNNWSIQYIETSPDEDWWAARVYFSLSLTLQLMEMQTLDFKSTIFVTHLDRNKLRCLQAHFNLHNPYVYTACLWSLPPPHPVVLWSKPLPHRWVSRQGRTRSEP